MKVAILIATYNKEKQLANTLCSIARQKTSFPFEVCIVDDCSKIDPEPIIREFLPDAKYKRLKKRLGSNGGPSACLDLVSPDVDVVVLMTSDIILVGDDSLECLCERVGDQKVVFGVVLNVDIKSNFHKKMESNITYVESNWDSLMKDNFTKSSPTKPRMWRFFLGAITKDNLSEIGYRENPCDNLMMHAMKERDYDADILAYVKSIHQDHARKTYHCPMAETCKKWCRRTLYTKKMKRKGHCKPLYLSKCAATVRERNPEQ